MESVSTVIEQINYDFDHFELDHFLDHIQQLRKRKLVLRPATLKHEIAAIWVYTDKTDYIFFKSSDHVIHQTHNILHEIAHMMLDHTRIPLENVLTPELFNELFSGQITGRPRRITREPSNNIEELEAEKFVFIVQERVMDANRIDQLLDQASSITGLNSYVEGMGFNV